MNKTIFTTKFYVRLFWVLYSIPFILVILLFSFIAFEKFGEMPTFEDLENPENNLASEVYSDDMVLLGNYYYQYRSYVNYQDLSPSLVNALVATEDIRFDKHSGIDAKGLIRVVVKSVLLGQSGSGGGSTITQQLAKNLFPRDTTIYRSSVKRKLNLGLAKFKEWVTAVKLEKNYTKEEILVMYLNTVPFGGQSFGIKSASKTFFNTSTDSLKTEESALLVGLLKAPTWYSPVRNPERSKARRNVVLSQMHKYNYISKVELDSLSSLPITLQYKVQDHNQGSATYLREYLRLTLGATKPDRRRYTYQFQYVEDSIRWETDPLYGWCKKHLKPDGSNYNLYKDGLRIYTTVDSRMQKYAEEAVVEHLSLKLQDEFSSEQKYNDNRPYFDELETEQVETYLDRALRNTERYRRLIRAGKEQDSINIIFNTPTKMRVFSWRGDIDTIMTPLDSIKYYKEFLRAGFLSVDPHTGYIKAYVGGPNFRHFKYDMVKQGKRQVGSTIKPFLYTLAMQEGISPCRLVPNVAQTFELYDTIWTPKNSGPTSRDGQKVPLTWGLANSVNYISAWLIKRFNPESVIDVMREMGVKSKIDAVPSIFLGTSDISVYEMVGAYGTFANKGIYTEPIFVTKIEDKNGNVIQTFTPNKNEVISEETAFLMVNLLQNVVRAGSGSRLRYTYELYNEIGGKTGTTQDHSDGWFMGVTPNLVSGAWVGGEERDIHFKYIRQGQGANMSLPIWALYMKKIYADSTLSVKYDDVFEAPENFEVNLDCNEVQQNTQEDQFIKEEDIF